jgi:hypothetical protein
MVSYRVGNKWKNFRAVYVWPNLPSTPFLAQRKTKRQWDEHTHAQHTKYPIIPVISKVKHILTFTIYAYSLAPIIGPIHSTLSNSYTRTNKSSEKILCFAVNCMTVIICSAGSGMLANACLRFLVIIIIFSTHQNSKSN